MYRAAQILHGETLTVIHCPLVQSICRCIASVLAVAMLSVCNVRARDNAPAKGLATAYRIFVTNELSGDMTVIDGNTFQVLATVALGKRPRGIQVSPDGSQILVALSGSPIAGPGVDESSLPPADKSADGIGVIDAATLKLSRIIRGVSDPEQFVVSPDGRRIYVSSEDTGKLVIIDIASGATIAALPVGGQPEGVGITRDGHFAYVASEEDNQISIIDTRRAQLVKQLKVGQRPRAIAFSPDGRRAYVTGENDGTVSFVDTVSYSVAGTTHLTGELVRPMGIRTSADGGRIYITTGRGRTLVAIDAATRQQIHSVVVGKRPWGLAVSPDGKRLFTANGPSNDVSVVDAESFAVIATIPAGMQPWGVVTAH